MTLVNLTMLLVGFAVIAHHFEESNLPHAIPKLLPKGWMGGLVQLAIVFCMSIFLDNIAASVIGGVVARHVYQGKVAIGFLASIVAAANAGGAGSVIGDTTTTMMWLGGISPLALLPAFIAALAAFAVFSVIGALAQHRQSPIIRHTSTKLTIDWVRVLIVVGVLITIVATNVGSNLFFPGLEEVAPLVGLSIWLAILFGMFARQTDWSIAPEAAKGGLFLVALVAIASLMPVELPPAAVMADSLWAWAALVGFRQYSADGSRIETGRLRLGTTRIRRWLRRFNGLVRIIRRRRAHELVSRRRISRGLGARRPARRLGLRDWISGDACAARLESTWSPDRRERSGDWRPRRRSCTP